MNIKSGTRVRMLPSKLYPEMWEGVYIRRAYPYYEVKWDAEDPPFLHFADEFEVI